MKKRIQCIFAWGMALILTLSALPHLAPKARAEETESCTTVESTLDFAAMNAIPEGNNAQEKAASKEKVKEKLLEAGAMEVENLFLKGNRETIVNPGGYNGQGYFVQKIEPVDGEFIQNATLNLGYWVCNGAPQGYVQVYVSYDNVDYCLVWEQREGNGDAFGSATRRAEIIELPLEENLTQLYVKVVMEHWNTYEGAGVAISKLVINEVPVDLSKPHEECTMVTKTHNFNTLPAGNVTAADIGAVEESNMYFGIDGVALLSPNGGYLQASATWVLEAAPGEPLHDCVLTFVGRTWWMTESVKNDNYLKIFASVDGVNYQQITEFRANDNSDDTQRFVVDLTEAVQGSPIAYVKMEWMLFDSPHIFGIRSVTLTGNTSGINNSSDNPTKIAITNVQSFTTLPVGKVDKVAIDAYKSANLMFGYDQTPLLTASEAGEDAYATWILTAQEGEPFEDCYLTLVGRFGYVHEDKKDSSVIKVYLSIDGENYSVVKEITPTDDQSDTQKIAIDLSAQVYGLQKIYVRVYWTSKDDPAAMGLRSMSLVANAGADYDLFTPALQERDLTQEESDTTSPNEDVTDPSDPGEVVLPVQSWVLWGVVAAVAIAAVTVVVVMTARGKKKAS